MRSLLFAPGDDARKLEKALASAADAVILDLEDSVAPARKEIARAIVAGFLGAQAPQDGPARIVRINALHSGWADADIAAVLSAAFPPSAIMLPKAASGADVQQLGSMLAVEEAAAGHVDGATGIIAIATEQARALFGMKSYVACSRRLIGLAWGGEDLAADLGAETNRDSAGAYTGPYRLARGLTLLAAAASDVAAIDAVYPAFRDLDGLRAEAEAARRDGFASKMAIHPAQVPIINAVFTPGSAMVARAERIVAAFAADPEAGVIGLDGAMIDRPHLRQAERVLARARIAAQRSAGSAE